MGFMLNNDQLELKRQLHHWYSTMYKQYFYYSGRAGTGKTTAVASFLEDIGLIYGEYICCAYVGKAVTVLLRKGYNAKTIHSLIYDVIIKTLLETAFDADGDEYKKKKTIMTFELKEQLSSVLKLIIVDECKMVPDKMITELLSFGIPIIFMGDENQLPPVMGSSKILAEPDFTLNEIMRQAEDDPIVMIANWILDDMPLKYGTYGKSAIVESVPFDRTLLTDYDMILCGKNKTRDELNNRIRKDILHLQKNKLYLGEKLVCRQNNWDEAIGDIFLTNGTVGFVEDIHYDRNNSKFSSIDFRPDFLEECFSEIKLDKRHFYLPYEERNNYGISQYNKFEYGYVLTTHLAQGSEADDVLFMDEMMHNSDITRRLRYTAVTRARNSIVFQTQYGGDNRRYYSYY